jgi:hypothetical protein
LFTLWGPSKMTSSNIGSRVRRLLHLPPSATWLAIFLPAFAYFLSTRLHRAGFWLLSGSAALGEVAADTISISDVQSCRELSTIFHLSGACDDSSVAKERTNTVTLKHALNTVQDTGLMNVISTVWRHDSELGRGYLLISQAAGDGRIWRWEVGGGPIAIGKTLHLEQSGCRSEHYTPCPSAKDAITTTADHDKATGSGGIAIDFHNQDQFQQGALVVAEWGEGRIVRLEENGARTPILLQVPNVCDAKGSNNATVDNSTRHVSSRHLEAPTSLLYTPFGDLLVLDHYADCNQAALIQLRHAVHVKALDSLSVSRKAHAWKEPQHGFVPEILFAGVEQLGSMALTPMWSSIYVTAKRDGSIVLLEMPLASENDDDDEEDANDKAEIPMQPRLVMNLSQKMATVQEPGKIAVDRKGRLFWAVSDSLFVIDPHKGTILGKLSLPAAATSLTLGEDGFLYITTSNALLRIRVREGPAKAPTNMVVRPAISKPK